MLEEAALQKRNASIRNLTKTHRKSLQKRIKIMYEKRRENYMKTHKIAGICSLVSDGTWHYINSACVNCDRTRSKCLSMYSKRFSSLRMFRWTSCHNTRVSRSNERDKRLCGFCILWLSHTACHKKEISEKSVIVMDREPNSDSAFTFEIQIILFYFDFYFHFCVFLLFFYVFIHFVMLFRKFLYCVFYHQLMRFH